MAYASSKSYILSNIHITEVTVDLHLSAFDYFYSQLGPIVRTRGYILDLPQCQHTVNNLAEHNVFAIEEVAFGRRDEELTTICIRSRIRHREETRTSMFLLEILIWELVSINRE